MAERKWWHKPAGVMGAGLVAAPIAFAHDEEYGKKFTAWIADVAQKYPGYAMTFMMMVTAKLVLDVVFMLKDKRDRHYEIFPEAAVSYNRSPRGAPTESTQFLPK